MPPVSVGPTTKAGWGAAATAFALAVITYVTGDQSAQETTAVELAGGSLTIFALTHGFRYVQSLLHIKVLRAPDPPVEPEAAPEPQAGP